MMRLILLFCISSSLCAWNAKGHQLIGKFALDEVKPATRAKILETFRYAHTDIFAVSTWMDETHYWKKAHYINLPFGQVRYFPRQMPYDNALVAIDRATQYLKNSKSTEAEKILALRILFHVIGDIHQPLHTVNFYSKRYRNGDKGGNLYHLPYQHMSLHHFWDDGGGYLHSVEHFSLGGCQKDKTLPIQWVQDSFLIAIHDAYFPPRSLKKTQDYQRKVQRVSQQQIQKAACHLAAYLDEIYLGV